MITYTRKHGENIGDPLDNLRVIKLNVNIKSEHFNKYFATRVQSGGLEKFKKS